MAEKTILVVDDEKNIRLTLSRSLEDLGRPVATAVTVRTRSSSLPTATLG